MMNHPFKMSPNHSKTQVTKSQVKKREKKLAHSSGHKAIDSNCNQDKTVNHDVCDMDQKNTRILLFFFSHSAEDWTH